jgi:hypothetical protein
MYFGIVNICCDEPKLFSSELNVNLMTVLVTTSWIAKTTCLRNDLVYVSFALKLGQNKVQNSCPVLIILTSLLLCSSHPRPLPTPFILLYLCKSPSSTSTRTWVPLIVRNQGHSFSVWAAASLGTTWGNSSLNVKQISVSPPSSVLCVILHLHKSRMSGRLWGQPQFWGSRASLTRNMIPDAVGELHIKPAVAVPRSPPKLAVRHHL